VSGRDDIDFLRGRADIAIIGTAALAAWARGSAPVLREFFAELLDRTQVKGA
jgi:tryptophan synthase alpha chain